MKLYVTAVGHSNVGTRRKNNEDNFNISGVTVNSANDKKAFLKKTDSAVVTLCDGMGGEALGEVASQTAVIDMAQYSKNIVDNFNDDSILDAIFSANDRVCEKMAELKKYIGTTLVVFALKNKDVIIANVGDSRAYLFRNKELNQLTVDDTEAQRLVNAGEISLTEAMKIPEKHKLTQHLGIPSDEMIIEPHCCHLRIKNGDRVLLCSDGLTDMVTEDEIKNIMVEMQSTEECADKLLQTAIDNGGKDNVTVVMLDFEKQSLINSILDYIK